VVQHVAVEAVEMAVAAGADEFAGVAVVAVVATVVDEVGVL
jgi:hypothetical protein